MLRPAKLKVRVLNPSRKGIQNAKVTITCRQQVFQLHCDNAKGIYESEDDIPRGKAIIHVEKEPFESDSRKIEISDSSATELFLMRKKEQAYFYRGSVKTPFEPFEDTFGVAFPDDTTTKEEMHREKRVAEIAKKHGLEIQACGENIEQNGIALYRFKQGTTNKKKLSICKKINHSNDLLVLPILTLSENNATLLTNEIMVKFDDDFEDAEIQKLATEYGLRTIKKMAVLGNFYHFTSNELPTYEVLKVSNELSEIEGVVFAEPNVYATTEEDAIIPTDFLFPEQWDHQIINTPDAWQFLRNNDNDRTFGSSDITIAVVDTGIDVTHPEFNGNVSDGSAKIVQAFNFGNMQANNNNLIHDHGTCCASAAAASTNNASAVAGTEEGVAGVAGNCRVLAIRRGGNEARYAEMYLWAAGFDAGSTTVGFPAQINPGADVITSSFGFSTGSPISGTMSAVFDTLTNNGRNGRGTLLFFSAGNNNSDLDTDFLRPWGMYNRCFSISASTLANDGTTEIKAFYSSFGSTTEFCAPSSDASPHNPPTGYGIFSATVGQANPLAVRTLSGNVNSGTNTLTFSAQTPSIPSLLRIDNGVNSEEHFYTPVLDASNNLTNQCTLSSNLVNDHNNGVNVLFFRGFVPGKNTAEDTLNGAVSSGDTTITLNDTAGFQVGQGILINDPGSTGAEANLIQDINGNDITLARALLNNHADGTDVIASTKDYKNNFGGTSYSTPVCAGTAALMLTANPTLTWQQVRDLMRVTAEKINPGETNANGRWQDVSGNASNHADYDGNPIFSEFYGYGRIDTAKAVKEAGFDIELVTNSLNFQDVPEGEARSLAVRFNVKSRWQSDFEITAGPGGAPLSTPAGTTETILATGDSNLVKEAYLWVTYTGANVGDTLTAADGRSVTVRHQQTGLEWTIPIIANTIERPTSALVLCLDQSGSMDWPSGIGASKRIDVLKFSANILMDVIQEGNRLGMVKFDGDAYDHMTFTGALGPKSTIANDPADPRTNIKNNFINTLTPNPMGTTAIGDGLERSQALINPVSGVTRKSIVVFTDGKETAGKYISEVSSSINDRTFAVGLGKAENIEPAALNAITNMKEGYTLLTDQLDQDSIFKLAKYFLQILAGVNNEDVVVDPDGKLTPGELHRIPFTLNDADTSSDVILMVPGPSLVDFALETPDGQILTTADAGITPGFNYYEGDNVAYFRMNVPVPGAVGSSAGKWHALVRLSNRYAGGSYGYDYSHHTEYSSLQTPVTRSIPYTLVVHASSNVNMEAELIQEHFEPGANIKPVIRLNQSGIPLTKDISVRAIVTDPSKKETTIELNNNGGQEYSALYTSGKSGVYQFRIIVNGKTLSGQPFTREQVRTATVWRGGNQPFPKSDPTGSTDIYCDKLCKLLACALSDKNISPELKKYLFEKGINVKGIQEYLKKSCLDNSDKFDKPFSSKEIIDRLNEVVELIGSPRLRTNS